MESMKGLPMIETAVLRYFREVARTGSLTAASETLGVATSAISRQVRMLEDHFGARLFSREARGMRLNAAGTLLLEFLSRQAEETADFRARFDEYLKLPRGHVRIAAIEGVIPRLLSEFTKAFHRANPQVRMSLAIVGSNAAADMVAEQQADLGLLFGPAPRGDLIELAFMRQPLYLVVSATHPLARSKSCSVAEAVGYPVVMPDRSFGIRQEIDRVAALSGIQLDLAMETNSIALMRQIAVNGVAVTFLPRHAVLDEVEAGALTTVALRERRLSKTKITLVRSAARPLAPAAQRAVSLLRSLMTAH
ncbi:LysR family transcriptional regulator [Variovorax sp.]|jgi:DNA-binding transcriptional LysR family regulator|uniref:LysR family transcriptional regulator n=1 Tax=Variovorax sp. TaxID=1871043 RepID=UPI000C5A3BF5|nr:LysR family transcriptional regulator [Variovorax sp.]MBS77837.1 LysR family transcriptional regulator [Variovorax sp.]